MNFCNMKNNWEKSLEIEIAHPIFIKKRGLDFWIGETLYC